MEKIACKPWSRLRVSFWRCSELLIKKIALENVRIHALDDR